MSDESDRFLLSSAGMENINQRIGHCICIEGWAKAVTFVIAGANVEGNETVAQSLWKNNISRRVSSHGGFITRSGKC